MMTSWPLSCAVRPARSRADDLVHGLVPSFIKRSPFSFCVQRCLRPAAKTPPYVPFSEAEESCAGAAVMSQPFAHPLHSSGVADCLTCVSPASHMSSFSSARYCFAFLDSEVMLP